MLSRIRFIAGGRPSISNPRTRYVVTRDAHYGSCKFGKEPSVSINYRETIEWLHRVAARVRLSSTELVSNRVKLNTHISHHSPCGGGLEYFHLYPYES
jgi:hypothetical protein